MYDLIVLTFGIEDNHDQPYRNSAFRTILTPTETKPINLPAPSTFLYMYLV